jgi:HNH endonuclease
MKTVPLTQGKVALVDDADYEEISRYKWFAAKLKGIWYAHRTETRPDNRSVTVRMHRYLMNALPGQKIDHKDRNGLNNQRDNLRLCSYAQNAANRSKCKTRGSSVYKGVSWQKGLDKWRVRIGPKIGKISVGCYNDELTAARAYDESARLLFGPFACVNFPMASSFSVVLPKVARQLKKKGQEWASRQASELISFSE